MAATNPITALEANKALLQHFWDLATNDQEVRVRTSEALVVELLADQKKHERGLGLALVADKDDPLEHALRKCSPLVVYSLRRLARGLASGRESARQGFAAALCGVLAGSHCVDEDGALLLLQVTLAATKSMKKREAMELLVGQVFGVGALVRAGRVHSGGPAVWHRAMAMLLGAADKRTFLREGVAAVVLDLADRLDDVQLGTLLSAEAPALQRWLYPVAQEEAFPEGILLALRLWPRMPHAVRAACPLLPTGSRPAPRGLFEHPSSSKAAHAVAPKEWSAAAGCVLAPRFLRPLIKPLLSTTTTTPRVHTLWGLFLSLLVPGFDLAKPLDAPRASINTAHLEAFWRTVCDEGLLLSSHERKFLALELMQMLLPHLRPEQVSIVLSKGLMRCVADTMKDPNSFLRQPVTKALRRLRTFAEANEGDSGVALALTALLREAGVHKIKGLANSRIMKGIQGVDSAGVHSYMGQLMEAFVAGAGLASPVGADAGAAGAVAAIAAGSSKKRKAVAAAAEAEAAADAEDVAAPEDGEEAAAGGEAVPSSAEREANIHRRRATEQLAAAAKYPGTADSDVLAVLRFFATHAFFEPVEGKADKSKIPELAAAAGVKEIVQPSVRALCAGRLVSLVGALCVSRSRPPPTPKQAAATQQAAEAEDAAAAEAETGVAVAAEPAKKKRKGAAAVDAEPAVAAAAEAPAADGRALLLPALLQFVHKMAAAKGARLAEALPEAAEAAWGTLQELTEALEKLGAAGDLPAVSELRRVALLHLMRVLEVYLLGDPEAFQSELTSDLRLVVVGALPEVAALLPEPVVEEAATVSAGGAEGEASAEVEEEAGPATWFETLVDTVLSLLSTPSSRLPAAALREAVEEVWRTTCRELTPASLQDLLRVIGQDDLSEVFEAGEAGDEDEPEVEEEGGSGSGGDSEDSDSEEEGDGKDKAAAAFAAKLAVAAARTAGEASGSGSDSEDEGATDADMFRLDGRFAVMLRNVVDKRQNQEQKKQALAGLRFRVVTLLEMFARKERDSPMLVLAVVPLLRAASRAARPSGDAALAKRLVSVLEKLCKGQPKLSSDLPVEGGVTSEGLAAAMHRALYTASRDKSKMMWGCGGDVLLYLVRCAMSAEPKTDAKLKSTPAYDLAAKTCESVVKTYFVKRSNRLPRRVVENLLLRASSAALATVPDIAKHCATARTVHLKVDAMAVLSALVRAPKPQHAAILKALKSDGGLAAVGEAMLFAVAGRAMKKDTQAAAVKQANQMIDGVLKLFPSGTSAETVLGAERLQELASLVCTVKVVAHPSVQQLLTKTIKATGIAAAVAAASPDAALKAKILASRADIKDGGSASKRIKRKEKGGAVAPKGGKAAPAKGGKAVASASAAKKGGKPTKAAAPPSGKAPSGKVVDAAAADKGLKRKAKEEAFLAKKAPKAEGGASPKKQQSSASKAALKASTPDKAAAKKTAAAPAAKKDAAIAKPSQKVKPAAGGAPTPAQADEPRAAKKVKVSNGVAAPVVPTAQKASTKAGKGAVVGKAVKVAAAATEGAKPLKAASGGSADAPKKKRKASDV